TGLVGYSSACAGRLATMAMAATHTAPNLNCRIRIGRSSRTDFTRTRPAAYPDGETNRSPAFANVLNGRSEKARFLNANFAPLSMAVRHPAPATPGCTPALINTIRTRPAPAMAA